MLWYNVGKVAVTLNSKTVTGTGTAWLANVRNGDAFRGPDGQIYLVENVATNTSLSIAPAYGSTSGTGKDYAIVPVQGYQRDLADQVVELIGTYGALGTAAAANLTTSDQDATSGRVTRVGDWGLGRSYGLVADPVITNNAVNGFYRSGSSDVGKPTNYSGDAYIKFGWSGSYATYLYGSPGANMLWFKHVNNGVDRGWKELMPVGHSGLGKFGALEGVDVFPGGDLSATDIGAGIYYVNEATGGASDLPFEGSTSSWLSGTLIHRQSGSRGGQIFISSNGPMVYRGRGSSSHTPWRYVMARGDFGFGGAHAVPDSWEAQKTGWYYKSGAKPAWGGGGFFLDLAYNTTHFNSGLRISTDPYTDNFYMNGGVSGKKEYRPACKLVHDKNIVGDVTAGSVIATGSNANGTWVRFADGTQICRGQVTFSGNSWKPSSPVIAYPMAFIVPPTTVLQPMTDGSGYYAVPQMGMGSGAASFFIRDTPGITDTGTSAAVAYVAIGVWK